MTVSALLLASLVAMLMWANSWAHGDRLAERSNRALRLLTGSSQPTCIRLADDAGDILYRCGNYRCSVQEDAVNWGNGPVIEGADYYTCTRSDRSREGRGDAAPSTIAAAWPSFPAPSANSRRGGSPTSIPSHSSSDVSATSRSDGPVGRRRSMEQHTRDVRNHLGELGPSASAARGRASGPALSRPCESMAPGTGLRIEGGRGGVVRSSGAALAWLPAWHRPHRVRSRARRTRDQRYGRRVRADRRRTVSNPRSVRVLQRVFEASGLSSLSA